MRKQWRSKNSKEDVRTVQGNARSGGRRKVKVKTHGGVKTGSTTSVMDF